MSKYGQAKYGRARYGGEWNGAVFDRTHNDVINKTSKAYLNASDLQRVDDNCVYLSRLIGATVSPRALWVLSDFPGLSEMERILGNIDALRAAYYTPASTPPTPVNPMNHWTKWNAAERILYDLYTLYLANASAYIRAGEAYAGETIGVI